MKLFLFAIWLVILAELPCGLRSLTLSALYHHPWIIFAGSMIGTLIVMVIAIFLGDHLRINPSLISTIGGSFFIIYGILLMLKLV